MRLQGREISPTRASQLALRDEEKLIHEGYEFLDEKRMLLAQELLHQLGGLNALKARHHDALRTAQEALMAAAMRHGLEELSVYPPPFAEKPNVKMTRRNFLGIELIESRLEPDTPSIDWDAPQAAFPSHEAKLCAQAFHYLMSLDTERAAISTNLHRLMREYVSTERRARALENVLMPEISVAVKQIGEHLEAAEQEEALLVRHVKAALAEEA